MSELVQFRYHTKRKRADKSVVTSIGIDVVEVEAGENGEDYSGHGGLLFDRLLTLVAVAARGVLGQYSISMTTPTEEE